MRQLSHIAVPRLTSASCMSATIQTQNEAKIAAVREYYKEMEPHMAGFEIILNEESRKPGQLRAKLPAACTTKDTTRKIYSG